MKVSSPLLLPLKPRRRFSPSASPSLLTPPSVDLIGPPCPLSNLRPTYYAALFPSLPTSPTVPHPYSLNEFPASPTSARLARVQRQLHAADLEWRLMRYRIDRHDQDFWSKTNTEFLSKRDSFIVEERTRTGQDDVELAPFYKAHLDRTRKDYAKYNSELWSMQASLLWPSLKAATRSWRWRWEVWRAGDEGKEAAARVEGA
ncbi:hypothetical protein RQP46_004854 [Phenoliferia psychrophenolica]